VDSSRQLRVVGEGKVSASPDRWVLVAAINAMADSAAEALTKVSQMVTSATSGLVGTGINESSLRTQNLLLHDFFDQTKQRVTARVASYELEVTTISVDELGSAVSFLGAEIGDNLQLRGVRPTVSDPEPLYEEAQAKAVSSARAKAQRLAISSGVTLGPVLSIEEQRTLGAQIHPTSNMAFRASGAQVAIPPTPIEPGVLAVQAFVTIVYGIE
jgi:uncharacterized protein YggE